MSDASVCAPNSCNASQLVDNDFTTMASTQCTEVPWMNIELAEPATIRTVAFFNRLDWYTNGIGISSIRVGTNTNPNSNEECKGNIDRDGVYTCTNPL